jgi:hypothetical protein
MIIYQFIGKQNIHESIIKKMPLPPPKGRTAYGAYQIKVNGEYGTAVRNTIPGIETENSDTISSDCTVNRVSMILP